MALFAFVLYAQDNRIDRIPLTVVVEDIPEPFPQTARVHLTNRINGVLSSCGIISVNYMERFVVAVIATPLTKDILPGPPKQIAQNLEYTLYIADNLEKKIFSTCSFTTKGVGNNENKAYMDAIKRVRPNQKELAAFVKQGKERIVAYYNAEVDNYLIKATSLAKMKQYEEALFVLSCIPSICDKYSDVLSMATNIYQQYIDQLCAENLALAKTTWMSNQTSEGAMQAAQYLSQIYPDASCYKEAAELFQEIKNKVLKDWQDEWNFEMKKHDDAVDIEKQRINAWQAVGVAYGEGQQPISNTITWLVN